MTALLILLIACTGPSTSDKGASPEETGTPDEGPVDADRDGYTLEEDCDDTDAQTNAGASERCDSTDNDCDGEIDEDLDGVWYGDADGDGHGDPSQVYDGCSADSGLVGTADDCDDGDGAVHPDADEICNGVDDNCDGSTDEGLDRVWYTDADGDGWGDPESATLSCAAPDNGVVHGEDCNDADASAYPENSERCDDIDNDCDGDTDEGADDAGVWYADMDGDGHGDPLVDALSCDQPPHTATIDDDCDDTEATVYPDAPEVCDGLDNDCDGDTDEGASDAEIWYTDADGDGYGDPDTATSTCAQPDGTVDNSADCDDSTDDSYPGALEICDDLDNNCDGSVDNSALDAEVWYADDDDDGYGDPASGTLACDAPDGSTDDDSDCDDADADIHPGAAEICDDRDNNCDRVTDLDATDMGTWYADEDADGYGDPSIYELACDAPADTTDDATDCDDTDPDVNPDATEVCDAVDNNCDDARDDAGDCPCNRETYGDHVYLFCTSKKKWDEGQSKCDDVNYHLVSMDSAAENTWVVSTAAGYSSTVYWWFGFNDRSKEKTWVWDGGSSSAYTNWHSGEPNNSGGGSGEDCAELYRWSDDTWNDASCDTKQYYICEAD